MRFGYPHFVRGSPGPRLVPQPVQRGTPAQPKAKGRTLAEFHPLKRAEKLLLDACRKGVLAKVGNSRPRKRDARKLVRAEFLRFLALGGDDSAVLHEHGVDLRGAWITGTFDVAGGKIPNQFTLAACVIDGKVILTGAETRSLSFENCKILGTPDREAIRANLLECRGGLYLRRGFTANGQLNLIGARIAGDLSCAGGRFLNRGGTAISAAGVQIDNRVFLRHFLRSDDKRPELKARRKKSKTQPTFVSIGMVNFVRATIKNSLDCANGRFWQPGGVALDLSGAEIGAVFLGGAFVAGTATLIAAKIRGEFACEGATFRAEGRIAINCDATTIGGGVLLRNKFDATGEVRFHSATISVGLDCTEARFRQDSNRNALTCIATKFGSSLYFRKVRGYNDRWPNNSFRLLQDRRFPEFALRLWRSPRRSLSHDALCVSRLFRERSFAWFWRCIWRGRFRDIIDDLAGRWRTGRFCLLQASTTTLWDDQTSWRVSSGLELDGFQYERLGSAGDATSRKRWMRHQIRSDLRTDFRPQPWEQLAHVLSDMGHTEDAKQVRIKARILARRSLWFHRQPWIKMPYWHLRTRFDKLLGLLVGYGYRPWRTPLFLLGVWALGAWIYTAVESSGVMAPLDGKIARNRTVPAECKIDWVNFTGPRRPTPQDPGRRELEARRLGLEFAPRATWYEICRRAIPLEYSDFHPALYSADLMVPFLDLKQRSNWRVRPVNDDAIDLPTQTIVRPPFFAEQVVETRWLRNQLENWQFIQPIIGWALLLLIAGTVSGLIKKD